MAEDKLKLALGIIIKDDSELDNLARCVKSVYDYVDGIFITGTNKPDTKLKQVFSSKKSQYSFFKWCDDFSKARNFNFAQIPADYDYILWLDSDDVVLNAELLPELVEEMEKKGVDWLNLTYLYAKDEHGNVVARQIKPRILKNGTSKWEKTVHECSTQTKQINLSTDDRIVIDHRPTDMDGKSERNLRILLKEYHQDKDKTDPRTLFYIAQTLYGMQNWAEAAQFYTMYFKKSGWSEEKYFALHSLGHCLVQLGETENSVDCALQMIKLFPEWSTGYFDLSEYYSILGDHKKVVEWTLIGLDKTKPFTFNFTNDLEYEYYPLGRLADAYMQTGMYEEACDIAIKLDKKYKTELTQELKDTTGDVYKKETFVENFISIADTIRFEDRVKASKLFECLPDVLDNDIRIQKMRFELVPPKVWSKKSIVIYCGESLENWAYPSIFSGIGGSEEMVIRLSQELTQLGYEVTVYNNCGEYAGNYDGVTYIPYYHFNSRDSFETLIAWRIPSFFKVDIRAKKKYVWLHDLAYDWQFNDKATENTDKFIFLSKFHRSNMPNLPEEKIFISNNGIVAEEYAETKEKRPYSLLWTSSYDRGLLPFIKNIWPLIKQEIPEVTLDVAYGWQNIDKELDVVPDLRKLREELTPLLKQEGIIDHNRLSHSEIADLYKTSQVLVYASEFGETNNISSQKAQAAGCYVITTPQAGATPEYLKFGELVDGKGIYTDKEQQEKYAKAVINYLRQPKADESARKSIVEAFSVKSTAESWVKEIL